MRLTWKMLLACCLVAPGVAAAGPLAAPGDLQFRSDLQLLNDAGLTNIPLTTWPVSVAAIEAGLAQIETGPERQDVWLAYVNVKERLRQELADYEFDWGLKLSAASEPRRIRTFEDTPREEAEAKAGLSWMGERLSLNLAATWADNPLDGDEIRPDGTFVGLTVGNWLLTAGWQDRWYGPGYEGSLILGTNARPTPGFMLQRRQSTAFESKWLSWIGPWSLTTFMTQLDDERFVNDALLFGIRGTFRPFRSLEIGLTRTAQWCGDDRPCDLSTFGDLLVGNDNKGVNVDPDDEPGNQLAGWDLRWSLGRWVPMAVYLQWIGEDGRPNGFPIGSFLRQVGVEFWGTLGSLRHRSHIEVADTMCREGGLGFSDEKPDCAYEHAIYRTGYRYSGRSLGHPADSDSLSYSIGSTLEQRNGHTWNVTLRYMDLNRVGQPQPTDPVSATPATLADILLTHDRRTRLGRIYLGLGYRHQEDELSGESSGDVEAFIRWTLAPGWD